jgi:hypothetical protein
MWEGINEAQPTKRDLTWLVEGMTSNTLVWVTDILQQNRATVDRHFWGKIPSGKFIFGRNAWLMRPSPICQISEFYKIQELIATLCCDNKRALELSSYARRRIRPSAKCTDIQQSLKATKRTFTGNFTYLHV